MCAKVKFWRNSASLILAAKTVFSQPKTSNYEILSLKRSSKSNFMPEAYVFPGGNISKSDSSVDWLKVFENCGISKQTFHDLRPVENVPQVLEDHEENSLPKYLSFRICAIRETFEECGILLCRSPKITSSADSKWASFIGGHEFIPWQSRVHDDSEEFISMCNHFEIYPDVWALKNWSYWITPPSHLTGRFKTVFFLAALHQTPAVRVDKGEIQDLMWITPDRCIQLNKQKSVMLPPPQFYELSRLGTISDVENLTNFATNRAKYGFETYWPHRINTDHGLYSILPGDDLYPSTINADKTDVPYHQKLPESRIKHRILHKSIYLNNIEIENFTPKCKHILPVTSD